MAGDAFAGDIVTGFDSSCRNPELNGSNQSPGPVVVDERR